MASSGSFNTSAWTGNDGTRYLTFAWTEQSQSIANNTTTISWTLKGAGTNPDWIATRNITLTIAGETVYTRGGSAESYLKLDDGTLVASGTYVFAHNDDGTKSFTVSAEAGIYNWAVNCTGSATFTLDTIARASQPSLITWPDSTQNVGYFGDTISVHMNRKSSSFTHTVRYEFGSQSGTIATGVGTGTTWTIPLTLMNLLPNAVSGSGRVYVDTYSGSTLVGTKYTGFTATVPSSIVPSCTMTLEDVNGIDDIYGSPVQGLSQIKITVNPTTAYSSPIASYSISADGVGYNTTPVTTGLLRNSGTSRVSATVTDKRGRSGSVYYDMSVQTYTAPAVSKLTVHRCDAAGTTNDRGEYVLVTYSGAVSSMDSVNTASWSLRYKKTTETEWTTVDLSGDGTTYTVTNTTYIFAASGDSSYNVEVIVTDRHNTYTRSTTVSTAFTLMNFHNSGTGIRFGGVAEKENTAQFDLDIEALGDVYGRVYGLGTLPQIPDGSDINDYMEPGVYGIYSSTSAATMTNLPIATAGRLVVSACTGEDRNGGTWDYREQIYLPLDMGNGFNSWIRLSLTRSTTEWSHGAWNSTALQAYPVGSIYLAYNHKSPASMFGGTWTRIENYFLWATTSGGTIGGTGGSQTHTLTVDEMPNHNHGIAWTDSSGTTGGSTVTNPLIRYGSSNVGYSGVRTLYAGGGGAHNNMPPYIQVSVWRRTA